MVKKKGKVIYHNNLIELISFKQYTPLYYNLNRPCYPVVFKGVDPRIYELIQDLANPINNIKIPKTFKPLVIASQYLKDNCRLSIQKNKKPMKTKFTKKEYNKKIKTLNELDVSQLFAMGYSNTTISQSTGLGLQMIKNTRKNYNPDKSIIEAKTRGRKRKFDKTVLNKFKKYIESNDSACLSIREMKENFESIPSNRDIKNMDISSSTY
jgi:hypothetical protein